MRSPNGIIRLHQTAFLLETGLPTMGQPHTKPLVSSVVYTPDFERVPAARPVYSSIEVSKAPLNY